MLKEIFDRRSVRSFTDEPVSKEQVTELLRAAMNAPSARNRQEWRFVILTGRTNVDKVQELLPFNKMMLEAPVAIIAFRQIRMRRPPRAIPTWTAALPSKTFCWRLSTRDSVPAGAAWRRWRRMWWTSGQPSGSLTTRSPWGSLRWDIPPRRSSPGWTSIRKSMSPGWRTDSHCYFRKKPLWTDVRSTGAFFLFLQHSCKCGLIQYWNVQLLGFPKLGAGGLSSHHIRGLF